MSMVYLELNIFRPVCMVGNATSLQTGVYEWQWQGIMAII
jgi:hypothetical protein